MISKHDYEVLPCELKSAQEMVIAEHYSKGGSNTAVYCHGLFRKHDGRLSGVAWWLPPTRVAAESVSKEEWKRVLSLTRLVVLPDIPRCGESFLIGRSIRLIRQEKKWRHLVTYADDSQGHTGIIYRATNWKYVGRTGPYPKWIDPKSGRQVAQKATVNRVKAKMIELGYERVGSFYKHKFTISPLFKAAAPVAAVGVDAGRDGG